MINDNEFLMIKQQVAKTNAKKYNSSYFHEFKKIEHITIEYALMLLAFVILDWYEGSNYFIDPDYIADFDNYINDKDNYLDQWLVIFERDQNKEKGLRLVS